MSGPLLVDASVYITLAEVGATDLLYRTGDVVIPGVVCDEISQEPAASRLERDGSDGRFDAPRVPRLTEGDDAEALEDAAGHLGYRSPDDHGGSDDSSGSAPSVDGGDVVLLAVALSRSDPVVVTDDKPLRETCKALSIPVSGSIGVLIRAVERGDVDPDEATDKLYAMDEVGARLSASLVRRAERLVAEAAEE